MNKRFLFIFLVILSACQAGYEDVVLQESMDCYIYVPKRIVLDDELPLFDHPIRLPCLMTNQDPLELFSSLAGDLAVGFDEHVRELLVRVVQSTCEGEGGLCENRDWIFWNRFDELTFETYVQQGHSLGTYLSQLKEPLAERYRIYENQGCFPHGTAGELSAEKQVELMIKAAALKIAGYKPDFESIAQAIYQ